MLFPSFLDTRTLIVSQVLDYGFTLEQGIFVLKKPLKTEGFSAVIELEEHRLSVEVIEDEEGLQYLPFEEKQAEGAFVSSIREAVDDLLSDIVNKCCKTLDVRGRILDYVYKKYGTVEDYPWKRDSKTCTLKTDKKKWYAIIMNLPYKSLGLDKTGSIDVMNLKLEPGRIQTLMDYVHYFPAYHMNKKHWISVLLDKDLDFEELKVLIDKSFSLAQNDGV